MAHNVLQIVRPCDWRPEPSRGKARNVSEAGYLRCNSVLRTRRTAVETSFVADTSLAGSYPAIKLSFIFQMYPGPLR